MREALQLRITLAKVSPLIWRRILVRGTARLFDLHAIIQHAFGWKESHLHGFETIGGPIFGRESLDEDPIELVFQETTIPIRRHLDQPGDTLTYVYDFGDRWEHEILVEAVLPAIPGGTYPVCIEGARCCPPEDCGGALGYQNLIAILNDPQHEEYEDFRTWAGADFDPEAFDLMDTNRSLKRYRNSYKYWELR